MEIWSRGEMNILHKADYLMWKVDTLQRVMSAWCTLQDLALEEVEFQKMITLVSMEVIMWQICLSA